jgi:hypothetical protein
MKLTLEIEWVPGKRNTEFCNMLRALCDSNPASPVAAIPAIENNGFVAKLSPDGEDLSIHYVSDFGEALPTRCAVLHSRARTPKAELEHQVAPYLR